MSAEKGKKSRKRRKDADLVGDDEEDGGPVEVPQTPATERKKKKKRRYSEITGGDEDGAQNDSGDEGVTPSKRKKRRRRGDEEPEWTSELDAELLTTAMPLISKNVLAKNRKSKVSTDLDFAAASSVGAFSADQCNERLKQLEGIVKPIKTRHQIMCEALEMVKSRSTTYIKNMFSDGCPKRPQSAYMLFCKDHRDSVRSGDGKPSEMMQALAQKWKELSDKERNKYLKKAATDSSRYDTEMGKFREAHPDLFQPKKVGPGKSKKVQVGPNPPARSVLLMFKADYTKRNGDSAEAKEACNKAWKELSTSSRETWTEKWRAVVVAYRADLTKLRSSSSPEDQAVIDDLLEKHTITKTIKQVGYDLFAKTKRAELRAFHPKDSLKEINDKLKVQWAALPDIDRQRYCQQAKLLQTE